MTKAEVLSRLHFTDSQLAEQLGITRAAVGLWPQDEILPENRQRQLKYELYPKLFKDVPVVPKPRAKSEADSAKEVAA